MFTIPSELISVQLRPQLAYTSAWAIKRRSLGSLAERTPIYGQGGWCAYLGFCLYSERLYVQMEILFAPFKPGIRQTHWVDHRFTCEPHCCTSSSCSNSGLPTSVVKTGVQTM